MALTQIFASQKPLLCWEREAYWPDRAEMKWFNSNPKWKQLPLSA